MKTPLQVTPYIEPCMPHRCTLGVSPGRGQAMKVRALLDYTPKHARRVRASQHMAICKMTLLREPAALAWPLATALLSENGHGIGCREQVLQVLMQL